MRRMQHWHPPRSVQLWMLWATHGGAGWLWWMVGGLVWWLGGDSRRRALCAEGLAAASAILVFQVVKRITGRRRPCDLEPHCWSRLLPPDRFSFPSGHALAAFAVAIALGSFYPSAWGPLLFCAASVAVSRVVLGMHFLSDVLAGAVAGSAIGYASYLVAR
ncbi:MAG: phosphatase PAP2 family protein [Acidobacteria bacterium]|nr:phosphatase PAP2 family protein [Acidobacteriota bacterium]